MKFSDYMVILFFADFSSSLITNIVFGVSDFVPGMLVLAVMAVLWKVYEDIRTPEEQ
jgi:hypothetical protein